MSDKRRQPRLAINERQRSSETPFVSCNYVVRGPTRQFRYRGRLLSGRHLLPISTSITDDFGYQLEGVATDHSRDHDNCEEVRKIGGSSDPPTGCVHERRSNRKQQHGGRRSIQVVLRRYSKTKTNRAPPARRVGSSQARGKLWNRFRRYFIPTFNAFAIQLSNTRVPAPSLKHSNRTSCEFYGQCSFRFGADENIRQLSCFCPTPGNSS